MANKIVKCKNCGNDIIRGVKFCTHCGAKCKSSKELIIGLVVLILILIGAIGCADAGDKVTSNEENKQANTETAIEYIQVSVDDLNTALDKNPLNASDTYKEQYVEITGRLGVIDASGDYIGVYSLNNRWDFTGVHCSIKKDEQLEIIKTMSIDDTITVRGKITSVGEILGYSLDIIQIAQYGQDFSGNSNDYTEREISKFIGKPCSYALDDYGNDYIAVSDGIAGEFYYETGCPYVFAYAESEFSENNIIIAVASEETNAYIVRDVRIGMDLSKVEETLGMTLDLEEYDDEFFDGYFVLDGCRFFLTFDSESKELLWACCREKVGE